MAATIDDSSLTESLLHFCRAERPEAFEQLFARHRKRLKKFVAARLDPDLRNRLDASDLVQEAQTVMYARLPDYLAREPMPFRTWALKTALDCLGKARRTHILTEKRSVRREASLPNASSMCLAERLVSSAPSLSAQAGRQETIALVQRGLAALNEADREVLLMRHLDGLNNSEIAQILELSSDAVSKRHGRALLRLHDCLKQFDTNRDEWL